MQLKDLWQKYFAYTPEQKYEFNLTENQEENLQAQIDSSQKQQKEIENIFPNISVNMEYMKTKYNLIINSDVILREFTLTARGKQYNAFLFYIDGMVDSTILDDFVLEPLMMRNRNNTYDGPQHKVISEAIANNITVRKVKKFDLVSYVMNCLMPQNNVKTNNKFSDIISGINSRKLRSIYRYYFCCI